MSDSPSGFVSSVLCWFTDLYLFDIYIPYNPCTRHPDVFERRPGLNSICSKIVSRTCLASATAFPWRPWGYYMAKGDVSNDYVTEIGKFYHIQPILRIWHILVITSFALCQGIISNILKKSKTLFEAVIIKKINRHIGDEIWKGNNNNLHICVNTSGLAIAESLLQNYECFRFYNRDMLTPLKKVDIEIPPN